MATPHPRRIIVGLVAVALLVGLVPTLPAVGDEPDLCTDAPAGRFIDVPSEGIHRANIDCIAAYGITVGVGGGNYDPFGTVRRGQMASFLVNFVAVARDASYDVPASSPFTDIAGTTHENNIRIAAQLGITSGATPTSYDPTRPVTREQMASFVAQALEAAGASLPSGSTAFTDHHGSVHAANIDALAAAGIVSGVGGGRYDPTSPVTRAQMASFLAAAARYLQSQGLWQAPPLPIDGPIMVLAARGDEEAVDVLQVRWNADVVVIGDADGFVVRDATNTSEVAVGTQVTSDASDRLLVEVDAELAVDGVYWLHAAAGVVESAEGGKSNGQQQIAFTFVVPIDDPGGGGSGGGIDQSITITDVAVDGTAVSHGGSVFSVVDQPEIDGTASSTSGTVDAVQYRVAGGSWVAATATDGAFDSANEDFSATLTGLADGSRLVEIRALNSSGASSPLYAFTLVIDTSEPEIERVETDPANDRLIVTFTKPVTCPDTPDARAAWSFVNLRDNGSENLGAPDAVGQPASWSVTCYLNYVTTGIDNGDYGTLFYYWASGPEGIVADKEGRLLEDESVAQVVSGLPLTFDSIAAASTMTGDIVTLHFNKPVLCASLHAEDFSLQVDSQTAMLEPADVVFHCDGKGDASPQIQLLEETFDVGQWVTVTIDGNIVDESEDHSVDVPSAQSVQATA